MNLYRTVLLLTFLPGCARDNLENHSHSAAFSDSLAESIPLFARTTMLGYYGDNAPREQAFWEYELERSVQRHGNMAYVWSTYASSREPSGEAYTTGINTITLWNDGTRWWIMGWMFDTSA